MQGKAGENVACRNITERIVYPRVLHSKVHPKAGDKTEFQLIKRNLYIKFGQENFIEDFSAGKMPHKIPTKTEVSDERAIVIVDRSTGKCSTISEASHIIQSLTDKIDILRLYVKPEMKQDVLAEIKQTYADIQK